MNAKNKKNRKVSSRNRRVNFIRIKNALRLGYRKFYCTEKITEEVYLDGTYDFERLVEIAKRSLMKEYKLKLSKIYISSGLCDDDFINNLITIRVEISK